MKTLIIKSNSNSFERYFSINMKRDNVDIGDVKESYGKVEILRKVINKLQLVPFYGFWLNDWKKKISNYKTVIIFDYVLSLSLVKWIRSKNKTCKIKIWLWNIPTFDIEPFKKYATLYCFDKNFSKKHNINFLEQFYIPSTLKKRECKEGVAYIGYDKNRFKLLKRISRNLERNKILYCFILQKDPKRKYLESNSKIKLIDKPIDYEKVIEISNNYNSILELNITGQSGLTLRTMEALFYQKKLITNNKNIKNFPFYNENDFYVLGNDKRDLKKFIKGNYEKINYDYTLKYSYEKWLNDILH